MNLSDHFTLEEGTYSETAIRLGISNQPDERQLANMKVAAQQLEMRQQELTIFKPEGKYKSGILTEAEYHA